MSVVPACQDGCFLVYCVSFDLFSNNITNKHRYGVIRLKYKMFFFTKIIEGECSGEDQICQFPFLYSGQLHYECSTQAPGGGQDLYGRCPVRLLDTETREASDQVNRWRVFDKP